MSRNIKIVAWLLVAVIIVIFVASIPKFSKMSEKREKIALRAARDETDPVKRIAQLEAFLKAHPKGKFRGYAHVYLFNAYLSDLKDTTKAVSYARGILSSGETPEGKGPILPELFAFYRDVGKADSAIAAAKEALALQLKDSSIYNDMGFALAEAGENLDLAVELCKKGLEVAEDDATRSYVYDSLGWAYFKAGKIDEATNALKQSVKLAGEDVEEPVLRHLGEVELAAGKTEDAIATYLDMMARGQFEDIRAKLDTLYTVAGRSVADIDNDIKALRERRMSPAPQFSLRDLQGGVKSLSDYKGKVVLLNFMQPTWGPCVAEFPRLEDLAKKFPATQFAVVSVDVSNQKKGSLKVVSKTGVTFPLLLDDKTVGRKLYKIRGTPTTLIINGEGMTVFKHVGYYKGLEEVLSKEIESLVGGPA